MIPEVTFNYPEITEEYTRLHQNKHEITQRFFPDSPQDLTEITLKLLRDYPNINLTLPSY